nr:L-type lectin-domain containing receptor kinase IX.1-like [Ipomoea batatas]
MAAAAALCTFLNISAFVSLVFASLVCSLSFNMPYITPYYLGNIKVEGAANITDQGIQLTPFEGNQVSKSGRAMYAVPLQLWDKASGNLADFATKFTFNINSNGNTNYGDGLAFFLADFSTPFSETMYGGGGLGLTDGNMQTALDPFVAVAFDIYSSSSQTQTSTVSINIRSMKTSVKTTAWPNDVTQGRPNSASITYSAVSKILRVDFTGYSNGQSSTNTLSCEVDLRVVDLPEFVSVGFSAATGSFFEEHTVSSWQFDSSPPRPAGSLLPPPNLVQKATDKIKRDLIIGVSVGVPTAVVVFVVLYCVCKKRRPKINEVTLGKVSAKAGAHAAKVAVKVAQDPTFECCANVAQVPVEPNPECCVKVEEPPTQETCAQVAEGEEDGVLETLASSILDIFKTYQMYTVFSSLALICIIYIIGFSDG